jgi:general secretion pathway protein G
MLASARSARTINTRRAAFTLVEVLVVVAIVVILASIGTIATFKFLEDAKVDAARAKANQLQTYAKAWQSKNDGQFITSDNIDLLANYAEDGEKALYDPWGGKYMAELRVDPLTGRERLYIYTQYQGRNGQVYEYGSPKDMEPAGQQ